MEKIKPGLFFCPTNNYNYYIIDMLFPTCKKIPLEKDELVKVILHEGKILYGFVEDVKGDIVWIKSSKEKDAMVARLNFKIDHFIKLN